jgi:hypothetical protein
MLSKIRERAADVLLWQKFLRGEADFCTLAVAIASGAKARPNPESLSLLARRSIGYEDWLAD